MKQLSWPAAVVAIIIGLSISGLLWVCQPYNDYLLNNSPMAGNYLPAFCVAAMMLLAGVVNPLLRWKIPAFSLSGKQLALIFGILLVACSSLYMIGQWHYALAGDVVEIRKTEALANAHKEMDLPKSFYVEPPVYQGETPASDQLLDELEDGNTIPWSVWVKPALSWGSMLVCCIVLMVGLGLIVYPQWRENERLPFPLLSVQQALIETLDDDKKFPPIFRSGLFWFGFLIVFLIYMCVGLNHHTGGAFPGFPTGWAFWNILERGFTAPTHWWTKAGRMVFVIIGITYFVPSRISFSIWFTVILYQVYLMFGTAYFAPFNGHQADTDHGTGAFFGIALVVLYLGRQHWLKVAKAMFMPAQDDADRRNRVAGLIFLVGCLGLLIWQMVAGNSFLYAVLAVVMTVLTSLVLARIVAETGIPMMGNSVMIGSLLSLFPIGWISTKAIYLTNVMDLVIGPGTSQLSATVTSMHGLGIDKSLKPRPQARRAVGFIVVMVLGMAVVGAVHLYVAYNNQGTVDISYTNNVTSGTSAFSKAVNAPMKSFLRGSWEPAQYNKVGHILFGFVAAILLQVGCLLSPAWPLHPVGMLVIDTGFIRAAWWSIMIGWLIKRSVVTYGGAKAYRIAKPIFFGMIIAEVFSALLWALVPAILIWLGGDAAEIGKIRVGQ